MRRVGNLVYLLAILWVVPLTTQSQDSPSGTSEEVYCPVEGTLSNVRPDSDGEPTEVSVGLRLLDVTSIEDIDQTITVDYFLVQSWLDPRLADLAGCQFSFEEIWYPKIDIMNSGRLFTRLPERLEVLGGGRVRYIQRFKGAMVFPYQAEEFPFDHHEIKFGLLSNEHDQSEVVITIDQQVSGRPDWEYNVPDWNITDLRADTTSFYLDIYDRNFSGFEVTIFADRRPGFYLWKIIMPLVLIVVMSWTVFWIDPAQFGAQVSMSSASMLTLIAFHFAMTNLLPQLSYFTDLDRFIAGATGIVFLALVESITTSYWEVNGRREWALRMDRYCRWLFPLAFALYAGSVFLV